MNAFIDHLFTPLGITRNYSATADLHTIQITASDTKSSSACSVNNRSLATGSNTGDSSASRPQDLLSQPPAQNSNALPTLNSGTRPTLLITLRHEPHRKHCFHCYSPTIPRPLNAYPLPRNRLPSSCLAIARVLLACLPVVAKQRLLFTESLIIQRVYTPQYFCLLHKGQTGSGVHLPSYTVGTVSCFPGYKMA
jgi:hypothetical protein